MLLLLCLLASGMESDPLLEAEDTLARGATAVYTVTVIQGTSYWILVETEGPAADVDIVVASKDMDFDHFMSLPYYEDFQYALGFALAEGVSEGEDESFSFTATYTGPAYLVVHDIGETGGSYELKVY
jgi:hypothetical protein